MVASKLTSGFAAASILSALQLQICYAQDTNEQLTLDKKTHAVQNSTTDATTSPIQDKAGHVVNVKTFGAVGDSVTNDTEAFRAALKSLADAGGGTCLVPKGTYQIGRAHV